MQQRLVFSIRKQLAPTLRLCKDESNRKKGPAGKGFTISFGRNETRILNGLDRFLIEPEPGLLQYHNFKWTALFVDGNAQKNGSLFFEPFCQRRVTWHDFVQETGAVRRSKSPLQGTVAA